MNEQALKNAIQELSTYQPSEQLWQRIESNLEWKNTLDELPTYQPKADLWERIEQDLPATKTVQMRVSRWSMAAAAIAAILVATFWWQTSSNAATIEMQYASADYDASLLIDDWNEDEDAFTTIEEICKKHPFLCKNQQFQSLKSELTELENAKNDISLAMQKYGKQARLINQIKSIEQDRSDVLKAMVEMI